MKILQVIKGRDFEILNKPIPFPGEREVLLKVMAVNTCPQWDLHLRHDEPMFAGHQFHHPYTPGQPGHEASGIIEEVGEGVSGLKKGDRVSAWRDPGHHRNGCYSQFVVLDAENVIPIPEHVSFEDASSLELAMCLGSSFMMLKEMGVLPGRRFGVMGLGPAGLIAVQMAKAEGASEVIGFDLSRERREVALRLGANAVYDTRDNLDELVPARPNTPKIDNGIDCVGAKATVEYMMDRVADALALFGVQRTDYTYSPHHYNGLRLCGYKGHSREAAEYALNMIRDGRLSLSPLISRTLPLEGYAEGIDMLERQEAIKICFHPWD